MLSWTSGMHREKWWITLLPLTPQTTTDWSTVGFRFRKVHTCWSFSFRKGKSFSIFLKEIIKYCVVLTSVFWNSLLPWIIRKIVQITQKMSHSILSFSIVTRGPWIAWVSFHWECFSLFVCNVNQLPAKLMSCGTILGNYKETTDSTLLTEDILFHVFFQKYLLNLNQTTTCLLDLSRWNAKWTQAFGHHA